MAIDASLFRVEDLDLDRLYANKVESDKTIDLLKTVLANPEGTYSPEEIAQFEARLAAEQDTIVLVGDLIERRRDYERQGSGR